MGSRCRSPSGEPRYVDIKSSFVDFFYFIQKARSIHLKFISSRWFKFYPYKFNIVYISTSQHSCIKYQPKFHPPKLH
jgi:hypothetical protein